MILTEVLGGFPFVSDADRAAAVALMLPLLYGPFWHPWTVNEPEPCFFMSPCVFMSPWGPYNVRLLRLVGLGPTEPKPVPATSPWLAWLCALLRSLLGRR